MPGADAYAGAGNRFLTNLTVAQVPEGSFIAHSVLPMVKVPAEEFEYLEFDAASFYTPDAARGVDAGITAAGDSTPVVDWSTTDRSGVCKERKFKAAAPRRKQRDAKVKGYDALAIAAKVARMAVLTFRERAAAATLFNTTTFASYTAALSGTDRWDDAASDPFAQRTTALQSIRTSAAYGVPGTYLGLLVGVEVDDALRNNAAIIERIKYTQQIDVVKNENIAAYFGVEKYIVGAASYNTSRDDFAGGHSGSPIWGKYALFFVGTNAPAKESPAIGYTFYTEPFAVDNWYDQDREVDWARAKEVEVMKIVNARAGYLFSTVVS